MRKYKIISLLSCICLALSSCGQGSYVIERAEKEAVPCQDVSLRIWVPEGEMEMTDQLVRNFDAVHKEYKIDYLIEPIGIDQGADLLKAGEVEPADIFYLPSGGILSMNEGGYLLPITHDLDKLEMDLPESAINAVSVDGNRYAIPFSPNSFFMYYNRDFYSESEVQSLEIMMSKDFGAGKYNFSSTLTNSWYLEMFFLGNGCTLFGTDGKDATDCTFNSDKGMEAGNYILDLVNNPKYIDDIEGLGYEAFKAGNAGAYTSGAWVAPELKEILGDKLGAAPLPTAQMGSEAYRLSNFVDFKTIAVNSATAYPEAAQKLAVYLGNKKNCLRRYENNGEIPVLNNLAADSAVESDIVAVALKSQANYATSQPSISQMDHYWGPMGDFGNAVVGGEVNESNLKTKLDELTSQILATDN
ncbi:extracellular solute-binding protein [Butyrivibrio sp. MC2013]|uniref:extracellular solute-binding protein n=1 Tax=Butyrivibrio sp. MC2013 TaxID=1280686 RepID=UPI0004259E54|nr:extracellular solute-binding protein [Butyrivibrio sp. MC2013]